MGKNDFNFVDPYKKPVRKNDLLLTVFKFVTFLLTIAAVGVVVATLLTNKRLQDNIEDKRDFITSPATIASLAQHEAAMDENAILKRQVDDYKILNFLTDRYHVVTGSLIDVFAFNLREGLYLENYSITDRQVSISGYAQKLADVADYEYILKKTNCFDNIFVNTIKVETIALEQFEPTMSRYQYKFDMTLELKIETITNFSLNRKN